MEEVLKADEIKLMRDGEPGPLAGHSKSGDKPRPIRTRAFWRALKRGELWALVPYNAIMNGEAVLKMGANKFAKIIPDINCPSDRAYIMWPINPPT